MVVAKTRELALQAADKVKVEYKKSNLAPVLSIEEVMHSAGSRIHVTETQSNGNN
jgi:CO/xanthine dehydrogenase Mo-binding subunit